MDWATDLHAGLSQVFLGWFKSNSMLAEVLETTNERIRLTLKTSSRDGEILLEAHDSYDPINGEPSDPPMPMVSREFES